jgi:hypothetical protein
VTVTVTTITDRFCELCDADGDKLAAALAQAECMINRTQWGETLADEATIYLAAHFYTVNKQGSGADPGVRTAESEGQISASYAVSKDAQSSIYGTTAYGRQYLELRRTAFPARFDCC